MVLLCELVTEMGASFVLPLYVRVDRGEGSNGMRFFSVRK